MLLASCTRPRLFFAAKAAQIRCKTLLFVDSRTKAKTIQQYLQEDYIVHCTMGPIRKIADLNLGVNVKNNDGNFLPSYEVLLKKENVARLRSLLANCDTLMLATDDSREGEAIAWHLIKVLNPKVPVQRIVVPEITKETVQRAISSPQQLNMRLVKAVETNRLLDRLTSSTLSPLLRTILGGCGDVKRVQCAVLHMICERERQRWEFQPSQYYVVDATFVTAAGVPLIAKLSKINRFKASIEEEVREKGQKDEYMVIDASLARELTQHCQTAQNSFRVTSITQEQLQHAPPLPFTTSSLLQHCFAVLNLSHFDTMNCARDLYNKGYITYIRTDSTELGEEGRNVAISAVEERFGSKYVLGKKKKVSNATLAHEAIRPAIHNNQFLDPSQIEGTDTEKAMYELIYKQTLASVMPNSIVNSRSVTISSTKGSKALRSLSFQASNSELVFDGFQAILNLDGASSSENFIDHIKVGDLVRLRQSAINDTRDDNLEIRCELRTALPPSRCTYDDVIIFLEEAGIKFSRPSTSSAVHWLIELGYVNTDENGTIVPTVFGMVFANLLRDLFPRLINTRFVAAVESKLDAIADGKLDRLTLLRDFYSETHTGLLPMLESVLQNEEKMKDKDKFRELIIPSIADIGKIMYYKNGVVLVTPNGSSWPLAPDMRDLRNITRESIIEVMKGNRFGSTTIGMKLVNGIKEDVQLCNSPYGAHLIFRDNKINIPTWLSPSAPAEQLLEFASLPLQIGTHPQTSKSIMIRVLDYKLCVGLQGCPIYYPLPDNLLPSQVKLSQCLELLGDGSALKHPELGEWEGAKIRLKYSQSYYISCGDLTCPVKLDVVPNLTPRLAKKMIAKKMIKDHLKRNGAKMKNNPFSQAEDR